MISPTIEVNSKAIQEYLKQAQRKLDNMSPLMGTISETMYEAVRKNFDEQGRPKWEKLSKATEAERSGMSLKEYLGKTVKKRKSNKEKKKKVKTWPGKILQREGMRGGGLLGSISPDHDDTTAVVGSSMPFKTGYAAIHHFGGKAGRGNKVTIPERPFLVLTNEDLEDIQQDAIDYLEK